MTEKPLTESQQRIVRILILTNRYILDSRYKPKEDWHAHVTPQDVLFLVDELRATETRIAELEKAMHFFTFGDDDEASDDSEAT